MLIGSLKGVAAPYGADDLRVTPSVFGAKMLGLGFRRWSFEFRAFRSEVEI